jgi:capsular exopolysaccharide synthesis family protein
MTTTHKHPEKDSMNLKTMFLKFLPFWPLFLVTTVVSLSYFYVKLKYTVPTYESKTSILIKDEKKGQEESKMEEDLNVFEPKKIVENEIEIFRSNSLVSKVVKSMGLYASAFKEKGWKGMATTPAFITSPITLEAAQPDSISQTLKLYFKYSKDNNTVTVDGHPFALREWIKFPWGTVRFLPNPYYSPDDKPREKAKYYFLITDVNHATNDVIAGLTVTPTSKQSSVITLTYKDAVPDRGEMILESIFNAYRDAAVERKNQVALRTLRFIEDRLSHVSKELDSVESGIQQYRDRSGVVDISEQSKQYLQNIESNDKQLNAMNLQLSALDEVENYVRSKAGGGSIVPSTFNIQDPTLTSLLDKLYSSESDYEKAKNTNGANNPTVLSLKEEIDRLKPKVLENINNQKKTIEAAKSYLEQNNTRYSGMLSSIPKKEKDLVEVSRQHNIKNDIYSFLLQKREETAYSISSILPDCYLVSKPTTSPYPVSPKKTFIAMLALILPVAGSVGLILLKDLFNNKILYRSDIEKLTDYPVIGELIFDKKQPPIVTDGDSRSFIVEQFRQIRAAIRYQGTPPGNIKRILVTSCIKGEGKSFVSSNLAISLARSGKKVALLEMDLHQPQISQIFQLESQKGITDFLDNKASYEELVIPSGKHENLSIISAGYPAEEPSELLTSSRLEILLRYLDKDFDHIVIDSAPFKALTDSFTIAQYCNLVLTVIRHNHTPSKLVELINTDMETHEIRNVAIIFNGVKARGMGKYSYGYGYGYGYDQKSAYNAYYSKKMKKVG